MMFDLTKNMTVFDNSRRMVKVPFDQGCSAQELSKLLQMLPPGANIITSDFAFMENTCYLIVQHKSFKEVPVGTIAPNWPVDIYNIGDD